MKQTNPMLLIDAYKAVHDIMLPRGINKSVSYFTPRFSRVKRWNNVVHFGLQAFIKTYLIDYFNNNFFYESIEKIIEEYERVLDNSMGKNVYNSYKIRHLHSLGYLPIEIFSLEEGTKVPVGTPMFGITNTHEDFAWLPQALESLISSELWHPMISATVGNTYMEIVNKYYDKTVVNTDKRKALTDMSFRGQECLQSAIKSSSGWSLSFDLSATVPAIQYLESMYNCDCKKETVLLGSPSTEHSVMCSNYAVDGNEEIFIRKMLKEIYPNTSFSIVLDSYDYWNVVDNILPLLKEEILSHNGTMGVRGDSGNCVDVVVNTTKKLWNTFGGTINEKGYKQLNSHVKVVYADSITVQKLEEIYKQLEELGFSCSNVLLGAGSFSFQAIEESNELKPFTRDTFSSCIKATYCEINGTPTNIFKNPKDGGFKKSQKGCCFVKKDLTFIDGLTFSEAHENKDNMLKTIFKDGNMIKETSLSRIRKILDNNKKET